MAAETIIESFCERCGTRYTFEPVRKRESKLVGIGKSLGILLDSPGTSLAARDPFHGTFHFCLECRQYTCPDCWNEAAGFCVGCVPLPETPDSLALDAAEAEATLEAVSYMDIARAEQTALDTPEAWPDSDLHRAEMAALEQGLRDADGSVGDDSWTLTFEPAPLAATAVAADAPALPLEAQDSQELAAELESAGEDPQADPDELPVAMVEEDAAGLPVVAALVGVGAAFVLGSQTDDDENGPRVDASDALENGSDREMEATVAAAVAAELDADADPEQEAAVAELVESDASSTVEDASEVAADPVLVVAAAIDADHDHSPMHAEASTDVDGDAEPATDAATWTETPEALADGSDDASTEHVLEQTDEASEPLSAETGTETDAAAPQVVESAIAVALVAAAAVDDDSEADWADLMARDAAGADDEPFGDDWSALASSLGPDVAPLPVQLPVPSPMPAPSPSAQPEAPAPAMTWQLTAPAPEGESRPAAWPPLGPVYRPAPTTTPAAGVPHPSVLTARSSNRGVLARGLGQASSPASLPNGVRPCVSCELPLSASARFCRRCGHPQS